MIGNLLAAAAGAHAVWSVMSLVRFVGGAFRDGPDEWASTKQRPRRLALFQVMCAAYAVRVLVLVWVAPYALAFASEVPAAPAAAVLLFHVWGVRAAARTWERSGEAVARDRGSGGAHKLCHAFGDACDDPDRQGGALVTTGPYAQRRHPIYFGYLCYHAATLAPVLLLAAASPSAATAAAALAVLAGDAYFTTLTALDSVRREERALLASPVLGVAYARYMEAVPWRIVRGVC